MFSFASPKAGPLRLACLILLAAGLPALSSAAQTKPGPAGIAELRRSFTLDGKQVPPEIFRDMGDGDLADGAAILVTVDLKAAIGSNQYFDDITSAGGWVSQKKKAPDALNGYEESAYRFIGAAANGLLVVETSYSGGGSGEFETLHILDLAPAKAFDSDGKIYERLDLTTLAALTLGDRWEGDITVAGNEITIKQKRQGLAGASGAGTVRRVTARRP